MIGRMVALDGLLRQIQEDYLCVKGQISDVELVQRKGPPIVAE